MPKGTGRPFNGSQRALSKYLHDSVPDLATGKDAQAKADREASQTMLQIDDRKTAKRAAGKNNTNKVQQNQVTPGTWTTKNKL